jgi:hypothetical protein
MSVRVMVDDEVYTLHILSSYHRQIALDDYRHNSAVLRHGRHVQGHVPAADWAAPGDLPEHASNFLIRRIRTIWTIVGYGLGQQVSRKAIGGESCDRDGADSEKGSTGGFLRGGH